MRDAERIWSEKSDEDLLEAGAHLAEYTEEGQRVIRAELTRRGFEDPFFQAGFTSSEATFGERNADDTAPRPECLRCEGKMRFLGTRRFHEGTRWGVIGEIGHLFENTDEFDVYACPACGHVELFMPLKAR
jgi:hypothetical protein